MKCASLSYHLVYPGAFPVLRCPYPSTRHVRPVFKYPADHTNSQDADLLVLRPIVGRGHLWQESQVSITKDGFFHILRRVLLSYRGASDTVSLASFTPNLMNAILNETVVCFLF